ncbi:hypothetical protein [Raoultibacter massiliensis]|uniref:Uncharacterized protein n=1 Tax=Raoultibacter massiliensis TaxID=1852371 RepID=A0ABV1JI85_9ACTN|nr:hypothetical protein [Raoultibacter massiliensis]
MATEEDILTEIERCGRLTPEQENILYNISLKQDELGREPVNMLLSKVRGSSVYEPMIEREFLTYDVFNHGSRHEIACLYVTLKGLRYCIMFADELSRRRKLNPAGAPWQTVAAGAEV